MASVEQIILCLRATNNQGEGASAYSILTYLYPEYIPGLFSFAAIITLVDLELSNHSVNIILLDANKQEIANVSGEIPVLSQSNNIPLRWQGANIVVNFNNINFRVSGEYSLIVKLDGQEIKRKVIFVKGKNENE